MAYLGQAPFQEYSSVPTKDNFTGDGSTTTFDLANVVPVGAENALEVYVANVRQEPGSGKAFTLGQDGSGDFKRITFASAPSNSAAIYVINDKTNSTTIAPITQDLNGTELILDADADTSITADTDDRIDLKIGNVEHISFGNSSGDTVIKVMADAKDILFQQYDGRTLLDINDGGYVAITNGATGPGQLRLYEDTDLGSNFTAFQVGTQSADITYTLPTADGTSGYLLSTDGNGALSWAVAGSLSGAAFTNDANNRVVTGTGAATLNGEANLTFDGSTLAATGNITATGTVEPAGDTAANDNAAIGYTSAEGLILTGQGSTNDVTIKNDADATVVSIPTGTTGVTLAGTLGSGAITSTGIVTGTGFTAGSAVLAEAELELLDGLTAGTAIASKVVTTDANIDSTGMRNLTISGTFSDGNYTFDTSGNVSGLGTVGSGAITSTGIVTGTGFTAGSAVLAEAELELLDGLTAGTAIASKVVTTDASIDTTGQRNLTITGELDAASLDIEGDADINGTLEADAITVNGSTLASVIAGTTVNLATLASTVTITDNEATNENNVITFVAGAAAAGGNVGLESDGNLTYNPSTGTLSATNLVVSGTQTITNSVTMNASNAVIFEGSTADNYETTLTVVDPTADRTITMPNQSGTIPVLAAASNTAITSTPAELNYSDGVTSAIQTQFNAIIANDWVTTARINGDAITGAELADNAVDSEHYTDGSIDAAHLASDSVTEAKVAANSIDSQAYVDGSIDEVHLSDNSVDSRAYVDGSIDTAHYAAGSVDATALGADAVTAAKIGDNVINSEHYAAGSIDAEHLAANSIDSASYVDGSIDNAHLAADSVTGPKIATDSITGAKIADNAVDSEHIAADSLDAEHYAAGSVDATALASDSVTEAKVAANSIDSQAYVDGSIDRVHLAADIVDGTKIANDAINSEHIAADSIDAEHYAAGSVDATAIGNDVVNSQHYAADSIDNEHLSESLGALTKGVTEVGRDGNDKITIGTTTIGFHLDGAEDMQLQNDGDLHVQGDVIAYSTTVASDRKLKENIVVIDGALDKIKQLNGVEFTWKKDGKKSAGVIAQDVEKVLPQAVKTVNDLNSDEEYKTVKYDALTSILIESIKELTAKVEESTTRIETLENR